MNVPSSTFLLCSQLSLKALTIFRRCTGSFEPSLLAYAIGTIISWTGLFHGNAIRRDLESWYNQIMLGLCVCAYTISVIMNSQDLPYVVSWGQQDTPRSAKQFVKMFHLFELDLTIATLGRTRCEILILRVLLNIRICINCPSTKNLCINKCDMVMHQTPRLISVSIHCTPTCILLVLSCGFSFRVFTVQYNNLFQSYYQNCHFMGRCSDCANNFVCNSTIV